MKNLQMTSGNIIYNSTSGANILLQPQNPGQDLFLPMVLPVQKSSNYILEIVVDKNLTIRVQSVTEK